MKKIFALLLSVAMVASLFAGVAFADALMVNFTPVNGATAVPVANDLWITFNRDVVDVNLTALHTSNIGANNAEGTIVLKKTNASGDDVAFTASYNSTSRRIVIDPTSNLDPNQVYYLSVKVKDAATWTELSQAITFTTALAQVAAPVLPANDSTYGQSVTMTSSTTGAVIHYTLDGTTPTTSSPVYATALTINAATTVKAIAVKDGMLPSAVTTVSYVVPKVATVTATPASPVQIGDTVTLATATATSTIHYTTDGSTPTTSSPSGTSVTITGPMTIKAIAVKTNYETSDVATFNYAIAPAGSVTSNRTNGAILEVGTTVTLAGPAGSTVYYTVDGTTPTTASTVYSAPIAVTKDVTIKAMAVETGKAPGPVATFSYTVPRYHMTVNTSSAIEAGKPVIISGSVAKTPSTIGSAPTIVVTFERHVSGTTWSTVSGYGDLALTNGTYAFTWVATPGTYRVRAHTDAFVNIGVDNAVLSASVGTVGALAFTVTPNLTNVAWDINHQVVVGITVSDGTSFITNPANLEFEITYRGVSVGTLNAGFTAAAPVGTSQEIMLTITNPVSLRDYPTGTLVITAKTATTHARQGSVSVQVGQRQAFNVVVAPTGTVTAGIPATFTVQQYDSKGLRAGATGSDYAYTITKWSGAMIPAGTTKTFKVGSGNTIPNFTFTPTMGGTLTVVTAGYDKDHNKVSEITKTFEVGGVVVELSADTLTHNATTTISATVTDLNGNRINNAKVTFIGVKDPAASGTANVFRLKNSAGNWPTTGSQAQVVVEGMNPNLAHGLSVANGVYSAEVRLMNIGEISVLVELPTLSGTTIVYATRANIGSAITVEGVKDYGVVVENGSIITNVGEAVTVSVTNASGTAVTTGLTFEVVDGPVDGDITGFNSFTIVGNAIRFNHLVGIEAGKYTVRATGNTGYNFGEFEIVVLDPKVEITPATGKITAGIYDRFTVKVFDPRTNEALNLPIELVPVTQAVPFGAAKATSNVVQLQKLVGTTWTNVAASDSHFSNKSSYDFRVLATPVAAADRTIAGVVHVPQVAVKIGGVVVAKLDVTAATIQTNVDELVLGKTTTLTVSLVNAHGVKVSGSAYTVALSGMNVALAATAIPTGGDLSTVIQPKADGIYSGAVKVTVTRDSGAALEKNIPVVSAPADVAAPTIEVNVPAVTTEATAVITVVVKDDVAVTGIIFGDAAVAMFPAKSHMFVRTVNLKEGVNTFVVLATDAAGNVASKTIEIERKAPPAPPAPVTHVITIGKANPAIGLDVPANVRNGRLMVPFRWFGEQVLGATVDYKVVGSAEIVTLVKGSTTIELTLNSTIAKVNGNPVSLDVAAYATGGRTLVPARFVAETFGYTVDWNAATDDVTFTKK